MAIDKATEKRTNKETNKATNKISSSNADVSAKRVFENNTLCARFLRNHGDLPLFAEIKEEDIEDVSERYHIFDSVEFNSDTVKKIRIKNNKLPVYVISLIEHKSNVDYNVTMQILKYMVCIWRTRRRTLYPWLCQWCGVFAEG